MMLRLTIAAMAAAAASADSKLMIHVPQSMDKPGGYEHREALFGKPPYGNSISQNVIYSDSTLCDADFDTTKGYPEIELDNEFHSWNPPFILMVDRGDCTFVRKVRHAQMAGASGVVIADHKCLCSDEACKKEYGSDDCEGNEPIMADDGSGGGITIPAFLMTRTDADKVKVQLKDNHPVKMEMKWNLPSAEDRVEYELWSVPADPVSREFLVEFKNIAEKFGKKAQLTPRMYIFDGLRTHCQSQDGENYCANLCTNNGRYCATDPDDDLDRGISGADVVTESLRRLCIWDHYGKDDGVGQPWWAYVAEFDKRCTRKNFFTREECIQDVYDHSGIDKEKIDRCMSNSGGLVGDGANTFLEEELGMQRRRGVVVLPTAFVNTAPLRGELTASNVFNAICAGFSESTSPEICSQCSGCNNVTTCLSNGYCEDSTPVIPKSKGSSGGVSHHSFAFTMIVIIAAFSGAGFWYHNKTRQDMRDQVRGILSDYMPLDDPEGAQQTGGAPMAFAQQGGTQSLIG